jgi:hypothetical protein
MSGKFIVKDIVGLKYGKLTIIEDLGKRGTYRMTMCLCECGNKVEKCWYAIKRTPMPSCGCSRYAAVTKHGLHGHPLYGVWKGMKQRCIDPNAVNFHDYGERGIYVCEEWKHDFLAFHTWCMANGWKKGLDIDRKDNDGIYEPSNCRFVTRFVGNRNTRKNVWIEFNGEKMIAKDWADRVKIPVSLLLKRIKRGWPLEKALSNIMYKKDGTVKNL